MSWSAAARRGVPALAAAALFAEHVVELSERDGVWFLPGFTNTTQGLSFTDEIWERLALALGRCSAAIGRDGLVDAGRLACDRGNWPVLRAADQVLLAVRPSVRSVHAAQDATTKLRHELGDLNNVSALVIGSGPYPAAEVASALQLPLGGALPEDRYAAAVLSDGAAQSLTKPLHRSPLLRSAIRVSRQLAEGCVHPDATTYIGVGEAR
ncbi:MAG: hypothetical protein JOY78_03050 [Pseudonocardia sp.]|nr:hypothetical protein [Pseudonocardia sp.]